MRECVARADRGDEVRDRSPAGALGRATGGDGGSTSGGGSNQGVANGSGAEEGTENGL